jgi:type VI secretion system secreted protein VgrG
MRPFTLVESPLAFVTPPLLNGLLLTGFSGQEGLSQLFAFELDFLAENRAEVPFDELIGQEVAVRLELTDGPPRHFHGICSRLGQGRRDREFTSYRLELVPRLWLLTRKAQSRIFQHMTVPDILKKVLTGLDAQFQVQGHFHPRDFVVQYRESDFAFASRLMEEEGIYYYFKHAADGHQLVLANTPQSHADLPGAVPIPYDPEPDFGETSIHQWQKVQDLRSSKYTLWDHSFELPHENLEADKLIPDSVQVGTVAHKLKTGSNGQLEVYDWPGAYAQRFDGVTRGGGDQAADLEKIFDDNQRTVAIRIRQEAAQSLAIQGASNRRELMAGHRFTLERHFNADGPYVLTTVRHEARNPSRRSGSDGPFTYANTFTCIPAGLPFSPPRVTARPVVGGTQSAVVVGPEGEEVFTDRYGRVKVQFHWDREGKSDADSSCWVRVAQVWAGKRWGASFWPRIGQEVVVAFEEGDPDRPIIIGSVYNAEQMPPYLGQGFDPGHADDNKVSGIKTNSTPGGEGYNELRFDDTAGKEQVFLHAQNSLDVRVGGSQRETVGGSRHLIVGGEDQDGNRSGDQIEMVFGDKEQQILGDQHQHIEGGMVLHVGTNDVSAYQNIVIEGDKKELITGYKLSMVSGEVYDSFEDTYCVSCARMRLDVKEDYQVTVENHSTHTVTTGDYYLTADKGHVAILAGADLTLDCTGVARVTGGGGLHLSSASKIVLRVGASQIVLSDSGVSIDGPAVLINSGTKVDLDPPGNISSAVIPIPELENPPGRNPVSPAAADGSRSGFASSGSAVKKTPPAPGANGSSQGRSGA